MVLATLVGVVSVGAVLGLTIWLIRLAPDA
jgi:hypothetical protein